MRSSWALGGEKIGAIQLVLCLGWLSAHPGAAQTTDCPAFQLEPNDAAAGDLFGCALSLSGDLLVAGSLRDDDSGANSGSATVFRREGDGWAQLAKLLGSDTSAGDELGFSVAVSGPYVIVGAPFNQADGFASGTAYAFRCAGGCVEEARLPALEPSPFGQFGISVSVDGTTAAVGAPGSGLVEIFRRGGGGWSRQAVVRPVGGESGDAFGFSVSIRGDTLLVGAPFDEDRGSAFVFQQVGASWVERRKLVAPSAAAGDLFGHSVALSAGTAVVGAPEKGGGAAYVFTGSGSAWSSGARLPAAGVSGGDRFGVSVAIDSAADRVLVGARFDDDGGADAGAAYVFQRSGGGWSQTTKLIDDRIRPGDESGLGAAIEGDAAVVGAFKADVSGADSGAAYAFTLGSDGMPGCEAEEADLGIEIEADLSEVCRGGALSYTITVTNAGPRDAAGAEVEAIFPEALSAAIWSCEGTGGAACDDASGTGDIMGQSVDLPTGGSLRYTVEATVSGTALGDFTATAHVAPAADLEDPETGNNADEAIVSVACSADLSISIDTDRGDLCSEGVLRYLITVVNDGTVAIPGAVVGVDFDAALDAVTWTCTGTADAICSAAGTGDVADVVSLPVGSGVIYTALAIADPGGVESFSTIAEVAVPSGFVEATPGNNSATEIVSTHCPATPVGNEFQVGSSTAYSQLKPSVAVDAEGSFVVVWASPMPFPGPLGILGQRFDSAGLPLGSEFQVNSTTSISYTFSPTVAVGPEGNFVVAWQGSVPGDPDLDSIRGQRFAADGSAVGDELQINSYTTGRQAGRLGVDFDSAGNFVVVWNSNGSGGSDSSRFSIQGQRFAADGSRLGGQLQVNTYTTGDQYHPSVAVDPDGSFVVVWRSEGSSGSDVDGFSIQGRQFAADGSPLGSEFQINSYTTGRQGSPWVAADTVGNFVVVWDSDWSNGPDPYVSIQGQRFAADGSPLGSEFQVNSYTTGGQTHPMVSADPAGNFVVVWSSEGSDGTDIRGQQYAADGSPTGCEFQVNTTPCVQILPWVAMDSEGDFIVVWQNAGSAGMIQGQRFSQPDRGTTVPGSCSPSSTNLCLSQGRFKVEVEWSDFAGNRGEGEVVPYSTAESGLFWFFSPDNWEMLVKVIDGCVVNERFWVFAAALTNVELTLRVTDTATGAIQEYFNPLGNAAPAIIDTGAFANCSASAAAGAPSRFPSPMGQRLEVLSRERVGPFEPTSRGSCSLSPTDLCLMQSRFRVEVEWRDFAGNQGSGRVVPAGSADSGLFWFFHPDNWEMLVKVVDGCAVNERFWVFSTALTNIEFLLRVTDTETGLVREYFNPLGNPAETITDTEAFPTCP